MKRTLLQHKAKADRDFVYFAESSLWIKPKGGGKQMLILNKAQLYAHSKIEEQKRKTGRVRALILKGRQQGMSTYTEGRFYWRVIHKKGVKAFILTHDSKSTANLFSMVAHYHDNMPEHSRPDVDRSNVRELKFSALTSGYEVGTAGSVEVGRGNTIQFFHGSEVAFWDNPERHVKGIMQAVPDAPDTEIVLESTANGIGNYFHKLWQAAERGENDFLPIFIPWFWQEEYERDPPIDWTPNRDGRQYAELYLTDYKGEQLRRKLYWRERKLGDFDNPGDFDQEYPATPAIAFQRNAGDAYIDNDAVQRARNNREGSAYGPKIGGFDPAGEGPDPAAFIMREGAKAYGEETWAKTTPMECVGICVEKIRTEGLDILYIDSIGIGAGVASRLLELGYGNIVRPVNFAAASMNKIKYKNKRAECWGEMKEWLGNQDLPPQIPDDDTLHGELISPGYKRNSSGQLVLEAKEDMRKRGVSSPNIADALALTFAMPICTIGIENTMQYGVTAGPHAPYMPEDIADDGPPLW